MAYVLSSSGHSTLAKRSPLLALIVLMHVGFIYLVNSGLRIQLPKLEGPITLVDLAPEITKPVERIRAPEPEIATPVLEVPPPEVLPIETAPDDARVVAVPMESGAVADTGAAGDTAPSVDPRRPIGKPTYPPQSLRLNEEGLVRVSACVQPDGRLSEVALAATSGFPLLDDAAVRHLQKPGIRMKPGRRAGAPVAMCTTIPIRFDIRNR
jgi:protein TonB